MIKKLDKLIIKAFLGPFAATFFITLVVLVLQFFWLWIDDFVGKGLSVGVILEFILYQGATLVPLALPLAVLLSSLMTFGNLGETYELVAVKSSGISLLRFMRPLFFVVLVICGIAFYFGNSVIPITQLKSRTLLSDIVWAKPAFDIKEGVFYDKIGGLAIKIGKKENDSIIRDIIIYEQAGNVQDNFIVATDGIMRVSPDKRFLEFNLKNGWRYQERGTGMGGASEFVRLGFKEYKKSLDLVGFQFTRSKADSNNAGNFRVMSMPQLARVIDSMKRGNDTIGRRVTRDVFVQSSFATLVDSNWSRVPPADPAPAPLLTLINDSVRNMLNQRVVSRIGMLRSSADALYTSTEDQAKEMRRYEIEWHRKISLSLACLVLFMIGAPLGSIIRKGGLGNSLLSSIVFFMLFYFIANTGEKFAKEGEWSVFAGMWLATFVLTPIGLFLTWKAIHDSQLFNREYYSRLFRKFRRKKKSL
ncbi:LptF/LptG family permease [Flaviaesturariibacter aridisoli]|uniref:LptF/LptG family permease n=1 Tax=Flaviaesturariibacter aridisoli TaxID=2545761 RepID=UPI001FB5DC57|nr:LptF/LptG family permease [Flaviaesturariibacter aridisoli]